MFQCFVMMNLFNMINCRVLDVMPVDAPPIEESTLDDQSEPVKNSANFNIFHQPFQNFWFWIVLFAELNVQFLMVGYPRVGKLFTTTPITFGMHMTAVGLGLGSWALAAIMKLTGKKFVEAMPVMGESEEDLATA